MFTNGSSESFICAVLESLVFNYLKRLVEIGAREMSVNKRRWSNDFLDSLMDFQNRTATELDDSLNKSKEGACLEDEDSLNDKRANDRTTKLIEVSSEDVVEQYHAGTMPTLIVSSEMSGKENLSSNILNLTMTESGEEKDCGNANLLSNMNHRVIENITASSDGTAKFFSCDSSNSQNTIDSQSIRSQSTQYSCEIFHEAVTFEDKNTIESKQSSSQADGSNQSNEFCSKNKITIENNRFSLNLMSFDNKQGEMYQRYFSSPVEFPNLDKEELGDINHPDIWDALLELDQALSPFAEEVNTPEEKQPASNILSRLSQQFKKTPRRFTEKLISILEDSIISIESPTKQSAANTSGISLHRMTGEFRKLCKFIEDESMPEWAPSMMNMTAMCAEKTVTPDSENAQSNCKSGTPKNMIRHIQDTPMSRCSPLALRALLTPKNKIRSRNQTPIKQFTPSADKSFEYWEKICNLMCDPSSAEKLKRKTPINQEGAKRSMDEMLTICERQMASLDDSAIELRTSEPCKKIDSEIKLKVLQAPRSKSVSKMSESCEKKPKSSSKKKLVEKAEEKVEIEIPKVCEVEVEDKVPEVLDREEDTKEDNAKEEKLVNLDDTINDTVIMSDSDTTSNESSFLRRRMLDVDDQDFLNSNFKQIGVNEQNSFDYDYELLRKPKSPEQKSFEKDFKLIDYSPQEHQSQTKSELSYDPDDPDCSLLAELALRRQRCLETAKLMMEIDQEDPMTQDDNKCVETLYQLGIQDKTFAEVEEDTKFLNTLNQCLEYRKYFSSKSKPIIKALQKFDTPEEMKKRTSSIIRSQSQVSARKPPNRTTLQRANSAKTLQDRKMTPRLAPSSAIPKVTPRVNRTSSLRATPRISSTTPRVSATTPRISANTSRISATTSRVSATTLRVPATTPRAMTATPRPMPRSVSKLTPQVAQRNLQPQSEQNKAISKLPSKTPHSLQKPLLRRPILRLTPKTTQKLTPPAELKVSTPRPAAKPTTPSELKVCTPRPAVQKLTPPSELKVSTPRPAAKPTTPSELKVFTPRPTVQKLTPPSETKVITAKPTPKRVANLKATVEVNSQSKTTPRPRFFVSPGHSPSVAAVGRKKPTTYFSDKAIKSPLAPHNVNDDVKSPIGLYINSVDNDLIQNIQGKINDRLLTPVSYGEDGKSPKLKIDLASKENQSPRVLCDENLVLPTVRYHSAPKVCLIDKKSNYFSSAMAPNSKTKKMLEPTESTVVIRHEGRVVEHNPTTYSDAEMSIRVQKVAEKTTPRRRFVD